LWPDGIPIFWLNADSLLLNKVEKEMARIDHSDQVNQFFEDSTFAGPVPGGKFVITTTLTNRQMVFGLSNGWIVQTKGSSTETRQPERRI